MLTACPPLVQRMWAPFVAHLGRSWFASAFIFELGEFVYSSLLCASEVKGYESISVILRACRNRLQWYNGVLNALRAEDGCSPSVLLLQ